MRTEWLCTYPVEVLVIRRDLVDEIVAHALRDHPDECCGVIAGPDGSDRPERFIPMVNAARSPTFYEFGSGDQIRLHRELEAKNETQVVIYHSHTATQAYPSRTDISIAAEPAAHYVLVSTRDDQAEGEHEFRSYHIVDGEVTEEPIQVVESYMFSHTGADDVPDCR
jgi:proteasome lid subunit RPN8/RPN11